MSNISALMTNVLGLLEEAAEGRNWTSVEEAYKLLSGNRIEVSPESDAETALSKIMKRIEQLESKPKVSKAPKKEKTPVVRSKQHNNRSVKMPKKEQVVVSNNKFDKMSDVFSEVGKEAGFDKINDNIEPAQRGRRAYKETSVKCESCQNTFEVNPVFVRENYTCDKCLRKRGL